MSKLNYNLRVSLHIIYLFFYPEDHIYNLKKRYKLF